MIDHAKAKAMREKDFFDPRNVRDEFKGLSADTIKHLLNERSSNLSIVASNYIKDFNWGSVVRSVNSFNAHNIIFTGRKSYDRRGAVGAQNYTNILYEDMKTEELVDNIKHICIEYGWEIPTFIAAEYDENYKMTALPEFEWPKFPVVIFGEEGRSLDSSVLDKVDDVVYIPMYGTVRSLNLASAASIFMYDYDVKTNFRK